MLSLNNVNDILGAKPEDVKISIDELGIDIKSISEGAYKEALVDHLKNTYKERLLREIHGWDKREEFLKVRKLFHDNDNSKFRVALVEKYPKYFEYIGGFCFDGWYPGGRHWDNLTQQCIHNLLTDKIMESMKCLDFSKKSASLKI